MPLEGIKRTKKTNKTGKWPCIRLFALVMETSFLYNSMLTDAGWSSLAARRAHNPKVVGSNPAPATMFRYAAGRAIFSGVVISGANCLFSFLMMAMLSQHPQT